MRSAAILPGAAEVDPGIRAGARCALFFFVSFGQQTYDAAQALPRRLIQAGVGADEAANHVPRGDVQRALGRQSHGQRHGTLRAEADAVGRRFLPGLDAYGLREHVDRDRFVSVFEFPIAAKTEEMFHAILPEARSGLVNIDTFPRRLAGSKYVERFLPIQI